MSTIGADYSCAGHWSLATVKAGHELVWHDARWDDFNRILGNNFTTISHEPERVDVVVGSPPCTGFSPTNVKSPKSNGRDPAVRQHVLRFANRATEFAQKAVLMEMVPAWRKYEEHMQYIEIMEEHGFQVSEQDLDAWYYGGTQKRLRTYVLMTKNGQDPAEFRPRERDGRDPVSIVERIKDPGPYVKVRPGVKGPFGAMAKWEKRRIKKDHPSYVVTTMSDRMIFHHREKRGLGTRELAAIMGFPAQYRFPKNARPYIGTGVDIRASTNILKDLGAWLE